MQMPQESERLGSQQSARGKINFLFFLVDSWTLPLEVLLRHSFGPSYLGLFQSAIGLFFIMCCAGLYPGENQLVITIFFWSMMFSIVKASVQARSKNRAPCHSAFGGISRLPQFKRDSGKPVSGIEEAIFVALVSWPLYYLDKPMSAFFVGGAICMVIKAGVTKQYANHRLREMQDTRMECEVLAARSRPHRYR